MSRIGKQPVVVPSGVTVTVNKDNQLIVKGSQRRIEAGSGQGYHYRSKRWTGNFQQANRPDPSSRTTWTLPFAG
jgi:ribosomal protein L6P/L9E